jgi:hypothetical protein
MISVVADELSKCNDLLQLIGHYENSSTNDSLTLLTTLTLYLMPAQLLCALFSVYPTPGSSFVLVSVLASLVFMFAFVRYRSHQQSKPLLINQQHRQLLVAGTEVQVCGIFGEMVSHVYFRCSRHGNHLFFA